MDWKVEIPLPAVSDALFNEGKKPSPDTGEQDHIASPEVELINQEAREQHQMEHPTLGNFVHDLRDDLIGDGK